MSEKLLSVPLTKMSGERWVRWFRVDGTTAYVECEWCDNLFATEENFMTHHQEVHRKGLKPKEDRYQDAVTSSEIFAFLHNVDIATGGNDNPESPVDLLAMAHVMAKHGYRIVHHTQVDKEEKESTRG